MANDARRAPWLLVFGCAASALLPSPVTSQGSVSAATVFLQGEPQPPDSAELLDRAQDAQRRFERIRKRHLPWSWGSYGGECDERVGRMCWHYDDPEDDWTKPDEPEELIRARETLVATLVAVSRGIPGDRWVLGQLVWYLGEGGRWDQAVQLTRECPGADAEWCAALSGLALHRLGEYQEAAGSFEAAGSVVDDMGGDAALDLRVVLDDDGRDVLEADASEAHGLAADSLLWLLADPLYLVPGNDRRTEHEARRVVNRIRTRARNPYSLAWGKDMSELVIRYGWAEAWERVRGYSGTTEPLGIVGRHPSKGRRFMPSGKTLRAPTDAHPSELQPVSRRPRTTYTPRYATVVRPTEAEVFAFDRGDSVLVVAAFTDSTVARALTATMPFTQGAFVVDLTSGVVVEGAAVAPGAWMVHVSNRPQLVSLEHLPGATGEGRRYRQTFGLEPNQPGVTALSDLMILESGTEPATLDDAARALRSAVIRPGETITVAWEVYGLGFDRSGLAYELRVGRQDGGFLAAFGDWIGVADGKEGLMIDWTEAQPEDPGPQLRFASITFPALEEGEYRLSLTLRLAGRSAVVRERVVVVSTSR